MIIFSLNQYNNLAEELARKLKWSRGHFEAKRFNNNELQIELKTKVKNRDVLVVGATMPPDSNFFQTLLLIDTLKKEGVKNIKIFLPYLAYSRQDHPGPNKSRAFIWISEMLKSSGAGSAITLDIHNPKVIKDFILPLKSISTAPLFIETIKKDLKGEFSIVAPDNGALDACRQIKKELKLKDKVVYFKKIRKAKGVSVSTPFGKLKEKAVLIDDMLDTGETLIKCAVRLKKAGVKEIYIFITHGLFTGVKWQKLFSLGVKRIYCTDSVGRITVKHPKIKVIPIKDLLADYL